MQNSKETSCPCRELDATQRSYAQCCQAFHDGRGNLMTLPDTAEELMRSRYSAFVLGLRRYLLDTWHETSRPNDLELDSQMRWLGLEIHATRAGGATATRGVVEFEAHYSIGQNRGSQREVSSFVRENGAWFYVDAL
ncbi:YchJ family protein [Glutamicibacter arilaitensis]|uniref:YchJ family protein n=1 Tax=Glutamicibacter arilaitensis TaxID=256701 RepID=UPI00384BFDD4